MQATRLPSQLLLQRNRLACGGYDLAKNRRRFTRLRLKRATASQAAAFPRRVFGKQDRYAKGPRTDRA